MGGGNGGPGAPPETGQLVQVRNRPAIITAVNAYQGQEQALSLVQVEYLDGHQHPATDQLVWELEPRAATLENAGWPSIPQLTPDEPRVYDAYVDAVRWTSLQSIQDLLEEGADLPLVSPWASAIQIEPYQLTPLLKALNMPRVSLLLADDVGLGKTIQAGLIATELIIRRRIKRMLIVCPASLQVQWQEEMHDKFHLDFTILDADQVRRTQRELGSDVNPWSVHNRIITSMDYLRQEVVYKDFQAAARKRQDETGSAFSPWDLLVVDEAHHFAPKDPTDESLRTRMMRRLTEWFEHRLFLTATPHNGFTPTFLGLMELLDPVRFVQKATVSETDRNHIETVMVRRLKKEINELSTVQRFPERTVSGVPVELSPKERELFEALREYRDAARQELKEHGRQQENWANFIFTLLNKRLLSSPYAFARTWWKHVGVAAVATPEQELEQTFRQADEDIDDDIEREDRQRLAAEEGGSWLFREAPVLTEPAEVVSGVLRELGWDEETTAKGPDAGLDIPDSKVDALLTHIEEGFPNLGLDSLLGPPDDLADDERLILFTEYKDTQDHLLTRLREAGYAGHAVRAVYGGMSRGERDEIKKAFNDPDSPMRILVGTDAASEGLNLQQQCRFVSHYEIPWNPMRLEQRNGRVDRHGQADDVHVFHYTSDDEADQKFLAYVLEKVHEARHDLGSVGTVIDQGVQLYFWQGGVDQDDLGSWVDQLREDNPVKDDLEDAGAARAEDFTEAQARFERASKAYGLDIESIRNVVDTYLHLHNVDLEPTNGKYRVRGAQGKIERFLQDHLADAAEAMPRLVFDPELYLEDVNGRQVYRTLKGTRLIRLGHPVAEAATAYFRRALWGQVDDVHRWTMVGYEPTMGKEAYVKLQYLVTARNRLQEVVRSDVGSFWFHVTPSGLKALDGHPELSKVHGIDAETMREWWGELKPAFIDYDDSVEPLKEDVIASLRDAAEAGLDKAREAAEQRAKEEFDERAEELAKDMGDERKERLRQRMLEAKEQAKQMTLDPRLNLERQRKYEYYEKQLRDADLKVWDENVKLMKERLERERQRFISDVIPKRYELADRVDFVEVGAKLYVPAGRAE